jgi:hypothetical protein
MRGERPLLPYAHVRPLIRAADGQQKRAHQDAHHLG